jgi:hypothetical protein
MKYFTLKWWGGKTGNVMAVNAEYCHYMDSVRKVLPKDLWELYWKVSLHDARLRRLQFADGMLELKLDGERKDKGRLRPGLRRFRLCYQGVSAITSLADPRKGLPGPFGYGDLGYHEIEIIEEGLYEHRILFSSGIELQMRFSGFVLAYEDKVSGGAMNRAFSASH